MTLHSPVHMPDFSSYMDSLDAPAVEPPPHKPMPTGFEITLIKYLPLSWSLVAAELCLYGGYVAMMAFYLHVLRTRSLARNRFLVAATIALFILCTAHCFLLFAMTIAETRDGILLASGDFRAGKSNLNVDAAANVVYITSNVIADAIFIFRCYAIWNFRLRIILLPMFLTLGVAVGRIWWLTRAARHLMGKEVMGKYYTFGVRSAVLRGRTCFVVLSFVVEFPNSQSGVVLGQLVGIAPTIIAVRVGLGYSIESVDSFITAESTPPMQMRFASAQRVVDSGGDHIIYIRRESVKEGRRDEEECSNTPNNPSGGDDGRRRRSNTGNAGGKGKGKKRATTAEMDAMAEEEAEARQKELMQRHDEALMCVQADITAANEQIRMEELNRAHDTERLFMLQALDPEDPEFEKMFEQEHPAIEFNRSESGSGLVGNEDDPVSEEPSERDLNEPCESASQ
ncbi:hypothetical protein B0H13DRAFT_2361207 [Mycena leptocephala]|nr:hypothetical protein B0H13DRAFT_2361207 [Mycena leptocephala]